MKINAQTKISALIKHSPLALDAIVSINPMYNKLKNPVLRKVMAPRVSIQQAAIMGGCSTDDFFSVLQPLGFIIENKETVMTADIKLNCLEERTAWLGATSEDKVVMFDVRPILAGGADPLKEIMAKVSSLAPDQVLCILNTFEPFPLIQLLRKKGYISYVEKMHENEVFTYFKKVDEAFDEIAEHVVNEANTSDFEQGLKKFGSNIISIDVRNLEMPQPMLSILQNLEKLQPGQALFVNHKRVPVYLLPELEERNFTYNVQEIAEGDVKMLIYHK